MRLSLPIPSRIISTSAPTLSQSAATSLMNEIRVASMALAAYLAISAEIGSMNRIRLLRRMKGA